jgi:hypothetical protein
VRIEEREGQGRLPEGGDPMLSGNVGAVRGRRKVPRQEHSGWETAGCFGGTTGITPVLGYATCSQRHGCRASTEDCGSHRALLVLCVKKLELPDTSDILTDASLQPSRDTLGLFQFISEEVAQKGHSPTSEQASGWDSAC